METNFNSTRLNCLMINGVGYPISVVTAVYPTSVNVRYFYSCNTDSTVPTITTSHSLVVDYMADTTMKGKRALISSVVHSNLEEETISALDSEDFMDYLSSEVERKDGKDSALLFKKAVLYVERIQRRLEEQELNKQKAEENFALAQKEADPVMNIIKEADAINSTTVDLIPATDSGVSVVEAVSNLTVPESGPVHVKAEISSTDLLTVEEEQAVQTVTDEEIYKMNKKLNYIRTQVQNYVNKRREDSVENYTIKKYINELDEDEVEKFNDLISNDIDDIYGYMR